ncbi:MAG: IS630 family transposase [Nitrospirae bacterium]|nr:IS630 family transposase [Nitrospirota bacterium]
MLQDRDPKDKRPVIVMAQDEDLFGRINNARRAWAPPALRPKAPRQYVFAAICPALGKMTALILPYANTETMNIFLRHVSIDFQIYFMIIVVDQAAWHMSKNLVVPENIRLIPQPAHSPELNPTEHLWEEVREKYLHNTAFQSIDRLEDTLCTALNDIYNDPHRLTSMTNLPYLRVTL